MKTYSYADLNATERNELCQRTSVDLEKATETILPVIKDVKARGDEAVGEYNTKFDGHSATEIYIPVRNADDIVIDEDVKSAFNIAYQNIYDFHRAQYPHTFEVETMPGVVCRRVPVPISSVGLYVPGGTAVLPSSVLMLGVPAQIAGCKTVVIATPPGKDGRVAPEVEYAAALCGVSGILLAGGAQAIAAMAYGTETVPKVHKIFGPGNQYVTAAKMYLQNSTARIAIDMPAGPSEVLVIADKSANPAYIAADLLSQAEHGGDSQVVLVAVDGFDLDQLKKDLKNQLNVLPRKDFAQKALDGSYILTVKSTDEAMDFSNDYAPEHLIIQTEDTQDLAKKVESAGSVFIGPWSPESVGDYASGTNHTLPTSGYAAMYSGVSLDAYYKQITMQELTSDGLQVLGPAVEIMADVEGLQAHKNAVSIRLHDLKKK